MPTTFSQTQSSSPMCPLQITRVCCLQIIRNCCPNYQWFFLNFGKKSRRNYSRGRIIRAHTIHAKQTLIGNMVTRSGASMLYQTHKLPRFCATTTSLPGTHCNNNNQTHKLPRFCATTTSLPGTHCNNTNIK